MHKNQVWLAFLSTIFLIVVGFSLMTCYELYRFYTLSEQVTAANTDWSLKKVAEDRYVLHARYGYTINNKEFSHEETLNSPAFKNPLAAKTMLTDNGSKSWVVWYARNNPQDSSLKNDFPVKALVYSAILWSLLLYFVWLGFYVNRKYKRWK